MTAHPYTPIPTHTTMHTTTVTIYTHHMRMGGLQGVTMRGSSQGTPSTFSYRTCAAWGGLFHAQGTPCPVLFPVQSPPLHTPALPNTCTLCTHPPRRPPAPLCLLLPLPPPLSGAIKKGPLMQGSMLVGAPPQRTPTNHTSMQQWHTKPPGV